MPSPPGGFADKIGNRYEAHYVVAAALELLEPDPVRLSLRWEGLGADFEGVEYRSGLADGAVEAVQCKSERDKSWTIPALRSAGLLAAIRTQLESGGVGRFTLVVAGGAGELRDLAERAGASESGSVFHGALPAGLSAALAAVLDAWGLKRTSADLERARGLLSRVRVHEHETPARLEKEAERRCAGLFHGPAGTARAAVREVLEANLGVEITAGTLLAALRSPRHRIEPLDWRRLPDRVAGVHALQDRFLRTIGRRLVRGGLIVRPEIGKIVEAVRAVGGPRTILVMGGAGGGKSGVLYGAVKTLVDAGVTAVPLRLDSDPPAGGLVAYSRGVLGLPDTPGRCASRLSPAAPSVVVVDQLDAVRWSGSHSSGALDTSLELIEDALAAPNVKVVAACRTFDARDDPGLRGWIAESARHGGIVRIDVGPLDDAAIDSALAAGAGGAAPSAAQRRLLRNPLMLGLWCELADRGVDLRGIAGSSQLLSEHWRSVKGRLARPHGISEATVEAVMAEVTGWAEREGRSEFPAAVTAHRGALDALASEGYLEPARNSAFRFSHQWLLDHQVALAAQREMLRSGLTAAGWLTRSEQPLTRRGQVRYLLGLLSDVDPAGYAAALESILTGPGVREHLRDLALTHLGQADPPGPAEIELVLRLAKSAELGDRVRRRTLGAAPWRRVLLDRGVLRRWLAGTDESVRRWATWTCGQVAEVDPPAVSAMLDSMVRAGELGEEAAVRCLPFSTVHDTPAMARRRFSAERRGLLEARPYEITAAAEEHPEAALRYAAHLIRWQVAHLVRPGLVPTAPPEAFGRLSPRGEVSAASLAKAARAAPRAAWALVAPALLRHLRWRLRRTRSVPKSERKLGWGDPARRVNAAARHVLSHAASALPATDSSWLWEHAAPFLGLRSRTAGRLVADTIAALAPPLPSEAIEWLLDDPRRFAMRGSGFELRRYWHGRRLSRHVWDSAPEPRARLAHLLDRFRDPYEPREAEDHAVHSRLGRTDGGPNLVGLPRYLLLSALPPDDLDPLVRERLAQWDAKFCRSLRSLRRPRPRGWFISRPGDWKPLGSGVRLRTMRDLVPAVSLVRVPDAEWVRMATPAWSARMTARWKQRGRMSFETPGAMTERAFGRAAKTNPARFARLVLGLPDDAADHWFEAALRAAHAKSPEKGSAGADWQTVPAADAEALVARAAVRSGKHVARALARLVEARPEEPWSDAAINHVCGIALSHPDPLPGEFHVQRGADASADDVMNMSVNCARGEAVGAIARLLWTRHDKRAQLTAAAERAAGDPHPAVRVAATAAAGPLLDEEPGRAIGILSTACAGDDRVLGSHHLGRLLGYLWWRDDHRVGEIVERMAACGIDRVVEAGAYFAAVIAVRGGRLPDLHRRCACGSVPQRKGTARGLAQLVDTEPRLIEQLAAFFEDADSGVAGAAASAFRDEDVLRSSAGPALAERFVASSHFARDPDDLIYPLAEYSGDLLPYQPALAAMATRAAGDMAGANGDARRASFGFADKAAECVLRIYDRAIDQGPETLRRWCLDQIDSLVASADPIGEKALARLDADA